MFQRHEGQRASQGITVKPLQRASRNGDSQKPCARTGGRRWTSLDAARNPRVCESDQGANPRTHYRSTEQCGKFVAVRRNRRLFMHRVRATLGVMRSVRVQLFARSDPSMQQERWDERWLLYHKVVAITLVIYIYIGIHLYRFLGFKG